MTGRKLINPERLREYEDMCLSSITPGHREEAFTMESLARFLGCDRSTAQHQVSCCGIPTHKVGGISVIRRSDVRHWLNSARGEMWVHRRTCNGRMKRDTLTRILEFRSLGATEDV